MSAADPGVVVVSQATATFLDRHPGRGATAEASSSRRPRTGRLDRPTSKYPPPATAEERAARRVKEREARSLELWKRVHPGYMGQPTERSEYQVSLEYDESKLDAAKNCSESNWKHHLRKTDTAAYVEAVAKERIFAKAAAAEAAIAEAAAQRHICQERRIRRRRDRARRRAVEPDPAPAPE